MKTNIFLLLLLGFIVVGCLDDQTNYNYTLVNEIKSIGNIESGYTIYPGDKLTLQPELKFTLDSVNPSVSYEWYLGMELVSKEPVFTYVAEKVGTYRVTLIVMENNSKLKTATSTHLKVDAVWKKGWLILSDRNNISELSIVKTQSKELKDEDGYSLKDTLVIVGMDKNISPNLGRGPRKLFEHFGYDDYTSIAHEVVVLQDEKCVELNGYTLEREVYTEEEFIGGAPTGFNPKDVAMTYKSNVVLDKDGLLYHGISYNAEAFHTVRYTSEPYAQGKKFSNIACAAGKGDLIMAVMENGDNTRSFIGIVDNGRPSSGGGGDFGTTHMYNGGMATLPQDNEYSNFTAEVLYMAWSGNDPSYGDPMFLTLLHENGEYYFLNYQFDYTRKDLPDGTYAFTLNPYVEDRFDAPTGIFDNFTDIAIFPWRDYLIVASGTSLYLVEYKKGEAISLALPNPLSAPITALAVRDFRDRYGDYEGEGPQLGVGLENGEFFVFGVDAEAGSLHEMYHADGLGVIKDVIYKYCSWNKYTQGDYH